MLNRKLWGLLSLLLIFSLVLVACDGGATEEPAAGELTAEEEMEGLDIGEHGNSAYPDFVISGASMSE